MNNVYKERVFKIWQESLAQIKQTVGTALFETWLLPLIPKVETPEKLILEAPDNFFKEWVIKNYLSVIRDALKETLPDLKIEIIAQEGQSPRETDREKISQDILNLPNQKESFILNPRYTFDNFIVGSSNRFAHAASLAVAQSPVRAYNPLFICGSVGLGKTHLMQAICHYIKTQNNKLRICYLPSEKFTNDLINAIQHHSTNRFRQEYRHIDVLVIDDIHFIAGKEATQEEFFHTFNTLHDAHKQIIISSDRPPREIPKLEERLISRFSWGLVVDIQPPDLETRIAILKKKIEKEPVDVPQDVIQFIAGLIKTNIRELEGALIRIIAYSLLGEKPITLQLCKQILKDYAEAPKKNLTPEIIQQAVAQEFELTKNELKSKKRSKNLVLARQIAMYLSRELTENSLPEIAQSFAGRDHTTILYAYKKINKDKELNSDLNKVLNKLIKDLKQ